MPSAVSNRKPSSLVYTQISSHTQLKSRSWEDFRLTFLVAPASPPLFSLLLCYSQAGRKMVPLVWITYLHKTTTKGRKSISSCSSFSRGRKLYPEAPRNALCMSGTRVKSHIFPELISITREILNFTQLWAPEPRRGVLPVKCFTGTVAWHQAKAVKAGDSVHSEPFFHISTLLQPAWFFIHHSLLEVVFCSVMVWIASSPKFICWSPNL